MIPDGPQIIGSLTIAILAILLMIIFLRRQPRMVWIFALALLIVGLGYLSTTPAPTDLARMVFGQPV